VGLGVLANSQADLPEVIGALRPPGGFAHRLHGRQQQRDQHADDGDHHQQFDQGESTAAASRPCHGPQAPAERGRNSLLCFQHTSTK